VEAEQLLHDHALLKQEIDTYAPDYAQMKEYGQKVVEGQEDVQYMFLRMVSAAYCNQAQLIPDTNVFTSVFILIICGMMVDCFTAVNQQQ